MLTQLAYDSRPIQILLNEQNEQFYNSKYPLFYKFLALDKNGQSTYKSALDISLESNQVRAVALIIDYIVTHQNSFIYSYLFKKILISLINRGVQVSKLLDSDIFQHQFNFELWPSTHSNGESMQKFYNNSFFDLRNKYD